MSKLTREEPTIINVKIRGKGGNFDEKFAELDYRVKATKSQLDTIPKKDYDELSWTLDVYTLLKSTLKKQYNFLISTNASLKMYEMIVSLNLISPKTPQFKVFCNAELPGAFISTIMYYMRTKLPEIDFKWVASSYYPVAAQAATYKCDVPVASAVADATATADTTMRDASTCVSVSTILGDIYGMYETHRDNWLMGPNLTGDLTDEKIIVQLAAAAGENDLYTSDAGIDVSDDFNKQEESTALLNFGQILCGLLSLGQGGNLVTKQYTFNTRFNRSLIAEVSRAFDEFYVVKPLTSRPLNSEIYLVGKNFQKNEETAEILTYLIEQFTTRKDLPFSEWAPLRGNIDDALFPAAEAIYNGQIAYVNEAMRLYKTPDLPRLMQPYKVKAQNDWIQKYFK